MRIFRLLASHPIFLFKLNKSGFGECYQSAIKWGFKKSKSQYFQGLAGPHIHFLLIPTRCWASYLTDFASSIWYLILLIIWHVHIIQPIRWAVIKLLSVVITGVAGLLFLQWLTTTFYHERQGNAITILAVAYQGILLNIWRTLSKRLFGRRGWMTGSPTAAWYPFSSVRHTLLPLV